MEYSPKIFEIVMLLCFGSSWPFAVVKTVKTKVVEGKSPVFLVLIFVGYLSGISFKLTFHFDLIVWLYVLNGSLVFTEILLYLKYSSRPSLRKTQEWRLERRKSK
ncbi:MAG: hypothetical protein PVH30_12955 [Desulfobacterales bacterium]